jgi:dienelactone hydrolase
MLQEYYFAKIKEKLDAREKRIAALKSAEQVCAYQKEVRQKLSISFGPLPERTPLNPQITGTIELGELIIDKIIFESRPGFYVSALFYRKRSLEIPVPAILFLCGHSAEAKACSDYQKAPQSFALRGFAVLVIDPYGQGERKEFFAENAIGPTSEHNLRGKQLLLSGEFFGTWRLWDAIRALDYLCTRPEVDNKKLGVTGTSGGGTLSTYLNAFDSRLSMAAPSCYVTSLRNNFENELSADAEQNPPYFLAQELDIADFIIASAPRPVLILAQDNDFFDLRGTQRVYKELKKLYTLLGKPDSIMLHVGSGNHSYAPNHRVAAGNFFCAQTHYGESGPEPKGIKVLPESDIYCSPRGIIKKLPGAKTILDFLTEAQITPPSINCDSVEVPDYRVLRPVKLQDKPLLFASRFHFGMSILKLISEKLYFAPIVAEKVTISIGGFEELPQDGLLYLLDLRGHGECAGIANGGNCENLYTRYGNMLGEPYFLDKLYDLLSAIALLRSLGAKHITLKADGELSVIAREAGNAVEELELTNTLPSFEILAKESTSTRSEWLFIPQRRGK